MHLTGHNCAYLILEFCTSFWIVTSFSNFRADLQEKNCCAHLMSSRLRIITQVDVYGNTALHYCSLCGNLENMKTVLDTALRRNLDPLTRNKLGQTPLSLAMQVRNELCMSMLIRSTSHSEQDFLYKVREPSTLSILATLSLCGLHVNMQKSNWNCGDQIATTFIVAKCFTDINTLPSRFYWGLLVCSHISSSDILRKSQ